MNEEQIRTLLQQTDEAAGEPAFRPVTARDIHRRLYRRRLVTAALPLTAAAAVVIAAGLWSIWDRQDAPSQKIASLEERVRQLQVQTDAALKLVQDVLAQDRQDRRTAALEAELAAIPDPMMEIERQVDKTAFTILYQADRLYQELNQTESAVTAYKEVIRLFPANRWAGVARERLSQIEKQKSHQIDTPGESKWRT